MYPEKEFWLPLILAFTFPGVSLVTSAQSLTVTGLTDKLDYADTVTFSVPTNVGFSYDVRLRTTPASTVVFGAGTNITITAPDFYELFVTRTDNTTLAVTNRYVRFLVKSTPRNGSEWGLPPQVPFPLIQSASNEFAGAHLRILAPQDFPAGYPVPIVAWAENANGHAVRANGLLAVAGHPSIQLRRGVGSGFLSSNLPPGLLNYTPNVGGLFTNRTINIESVTTWTTASGLLGNTVWPAGARIQVTGNLTVPPGVTLTVGAGAIIRLNGGIDITNNGSVVINGTADQPVVFMPTVRSQPWGGFISKTLNAGSVTGTGVIFTGSGAVPNWFPTTNYMGGTIDSHRKEQPLFFCLGGQPINLSDAAAMFLAGQLGHSFTGVTPVSLTRFLMQRTTSGGEFTGANFTVNDSAFIECPDDTVNFVDGDNDALYLVSGSHNFTNSLFGWTKDDGIDSGGDGVGVLNYQSCWFEATFHEGNSLSGLKNTKAFDTVYYDCGQGIEDGYGAGSGGPTGRVERCMFVECQSGVRHGDNYPSIGNGYPGLITATNCILLHNHRDVFGFNWRSGGWTNSYGQMFINNNLFTVADTNFPNNGVWNPGADGARLAAFGGRGRVGVGLAVRAGQGALGDFPDGIPVGLSSFCTNEVTVGYSVLGTDGATSIGTLVFPSGKTRASIPMPGAFNGVLRVALENPVNAELTGTTRLLFQNTAAAPLIPLGSTWRYLDDGSNQGTAWRATNFNDSAWSNGVARLGFGPDAAATTTIRRYLSGTSGAQFTNYYFRRAFVVANPADFATLQFRYQRDDGCVVYLNGSAIITNNMPPGVPNFQTFAASTVTPASETLKFWTNLLPAALLQTGSNVVAAEVHQSTSSSSDIAWELELQGLPAAQPARVNLSRLGGDAILYWNEPGFILEEADAVTGTWLTPATSNSPAAEPITGTKFFRLRK